MVWLGYDYAWGGSYKDCYKEQSLNGKTIDKDLLQPLKFQGQSLDIETGLHYNRFRYHDSDVGMFIQRDPIGLLGGVNVFAYAPNPVGWVDPWGLSPCNEVTIHRGTNIGNEIQIHQETGYIMSDMARRAYTEAIYSNKTQREAIDIALQASHKAHLENIRHFGSLDNYMIAHTKQGMEISAPNPRTMISFTTDVSVTSRFGNSVYSTTTNSSNIKKQNLVDGSESEVFVFHMIKI